MTTAELLELTATVALSRKQGSLHMHVPTGGDGERANDWQAHAAWHESKIRVRWEDGHGPTLDAALRDLLGKLGEEVPE